MRYLTLIALSIMAASTANAKLNLYEDVEGVRYRIQIVSNTEALVFNKSAIVRGSIGERDNRIAAVERTTGCKVVDQMWSGVRFSVRLDCAGRDLTAEMQAKAKARK